LIICERKVRRWRRTYTDACVCRKKVYPSVVRKGTGKNRQRNRERENNAKKIHWRQRRVF